jgi:hypothetical protein
VVCLLLRPYDRLVSLGAPSDDQVAHVEDFDADGVDIPGANRLSSISRPSPRSPIGNGFRRCTSSGWSG